jgi:eukaryotic-like serine/threonine-protein kinase
VTQELELVYWKDVRDSTEPEELEGFLEKFPGGIYADLARRRLRKLAGGSSPDQTILSGAVPPSADQDLDATRMRSGTSPSTMPVSPPQSAAVVASVAAAVAAAAAPKPEGTAAPAIAAAAPVLPAKEDYTRTIVEPRVPDSAVAPVPIPEKEILPDQAPLAAAEAARPAPVASAKNAGKKPMLGIAAAAGVAAIALIVGAVMMGGKGPGTSANSAAAGASAPAVASSDAAAVSLSSKPATDVPAAAALPVAAASTAPLADASKASAVRRPASAVKPKAKPASVAAPEPARPVPAAPAVRREEAKPASTPAAAATASVEVCRDKMFLAKEFCLVEECAKPGSRNHPLCVKHREEVRLREESKIRN